MKIGMRGGHSPNCKGASGYLDEQSCVRALYYKIKPLLEAQGHTVIDCNSNASSQNQELYEGTYKCNTNHCDLYIPLHMNATPGGHGVECWTYSSNSSTANAIGNRVCSNLSTIGLSNRGVKHSTGLHDTRSACGQTCLIEVLFCDNKHDCDIWNNQGIDKIAQLIASAICNKTITSSKSKNTTSKKSEPKRPSKKIVIYDNGIDQNSAEYLADFLDCPTIENKRPFYYDDYNEVYAVGGSKEGRTGYLKYLISGSDRYDTFEKVIDYILNHKK